ncbi:MAG: iron ABC transporter substrate-binding protein, partial [Parvibaculum sp.]|nr:iron ABC transporter substrate-binding protein [Parvibaculum sp.]
MRRRDLLRALAVTPWLAVVPAGAWAKKSAGSTIAATFGTIPPPQKIRRVFAAGAPASVLLCVLAPEKLIGWPFKVSDEARAWLAPAVRALPEAGRLAGRGSTVSSEALLQMKPDVILDVGTVDATYLSAMQRVAKQTGLPCVLVQGRLADHPAQLREAG